MKKRSLSEELLERGLIYQYSAETVAEILDTTIRKGYLGVDPSADSIHVGNLVTYILAQHLKNHGHEMILLVGGATGLVGDPSFKDDERDVVSPEVIAQRAESIKKQISNIHGLDKMKLVNNYDWFKDMDVMTFLREVGKHFNVGTMVKRDSVKKRIEGENGISYAEFSYALIQGYDYYYLHINEGCDLQVGGSDQWGNIISGVDFIRRKTGKTVYAITLALITDKATGKKFGKSEGNAVWLDSSKTSPYEFYQFWLNTDDLSVVDYLKKFTFLTLEQIGDIEITHEQDPGKRYAQRILADEVTTFVHGPDLAKSVKEVSEILFYGGKLTDISATTKNILLKEAPTYKPTNQEGIVDLLVATGLASSKREAREFIQNKAVTINDNVIVDVDANLRSLRLEGLALLKRGKKNLCILNLE